MYAKPYQTLEKFKLISNGNITNIIPFCNVYGDVNMVVILSTSSKKLFGLYGI